MIKNVSLIRVIDVICKERRKLLPHLNTREKLPEIHLESSTYVPWNLVSDSHLVKLKARKSVRCFGMADKEDTRNTFRVWHSKDLCILPRRQT